MTKKLIETPSGFEMAAKNLVDAAVKLTEAAREIDKNGWPREMYVPYTLLRNAANLAIAAFDRTVQDRRREANREAVERNLRREPS